MEILSDATFKGNVSINGNLASYGHFSITPYGANDPILKTDVCSNGCFLHINATEWIHSGLAVDGETRLQYTRINSDTSIHGTATISNLSITGIDSSHSGYLNLNNQVITAWSGLIKYISPITFTSPSIPANCTAFEFTGTAISDSNTTHLIQVQNTSTGKSVIAETWMTTNKKPAMSFAGCTSTISAGTYTAMVV